MANENWELICYVKSALDPVRYPIMLRIQKGKKDGRISLTFCRRFRGELRPVWNYNPVQLQQVASLAMPIAMAPVDDIDKLTKFCQQHYLEIVDEYGCGLCENGKPFKVKLGEISEQKNRKST